MCDCKPKDTCCFSNESFYDNSFKYDLYRDDPFIRDRLYSYRRIYDAYETMALILRLRRS